MSEIDQQCPICQHEKTREHCVKQAFGQPWQIRQCRACGHGFVANRPTLELLTRINESASTGHDWGSFATPERYASRWDCAEMADAIARRASRTSGLALDVGCGDGCYSY